MSIYDLEITAIQALIRKEIGLDENALSRDVVRSAVENRLRNYSEISAKEYQIIVEEDASERIALCQLLLVPESWLMREPATLEEGRNYLRKLHQSAPNSGVRLLSAPCARGEEAVSLMHIALEAGYRLEQVEVVGIDLSETALSLASAGLFGEGSFRNTDHLFISKYFRSIKGGRELKAEFRSRIRFAKMNLLDNLLIQLENQFSLILCRNVLIYLGEAERELVLANLVSLLPEGGFLGVGAAESALIANQKLIHHRNTLSSVYFLGSASEVKSKEKLLPRKKIKNIPLRLSQPKAEVPKMQTAVPMVRAAHLDEIQTVNGDLQSILEQAFSLADSGNLADAQETCLYLIDQDPLQAEAYYLLGLLAVAQNDVQLSTAYFKRVLYLNPKHDEAKLQLSAQIRRPSSEIKSQEKSR